jgi:hypothetical protein
MSGTHRIAVKGCRGHRGTLRYCLCGVTQIGVRRCKPLVVDVCTLVSYMVECSVWFVWEYMLGTKGEWVMYIRRLLSVTSTLLQVQYLK